VGCGEPCACRGGDGVKIQTRAKCGECGRVFDLLDEDEAGEFFYGHDCEVTDDDE
jgi:hypothetical protein